MRRRSTPAVESRFATLARLPDDIESTSRGIEPLQLGNPLGASSKPRATLGASRKGHRSHSLGSFGSLALVADCMDSSCGFCSLTLLRGKKWMLQTNAFEILLLMLKRFHLSLEVLAVFGIGFR